MAKPKRSKGRSKPPARTDTYEAEEEVPHEEKFAGQRYDVSDADLQDTFLFTYLT